MLSLLSMLLLAGALSVRPAWAQDTVTVTVDRAVIEGTSQLRLGITHTQKSLEWGAPEAVARAKGLLRGVVAYQNQHLMGWGGGNPEPSPGIYDFTSLDSRVQMMRSIGGPMVITLCGAPDWMKGGESGKTDWSKLETAPLREHYGDFAELARRIALRYPDVEYFQVWNEMKGLWDREANNWDYRGYTEMYNLVYDAIKSVRPEAKVGGLYMVVEGTGTLKDKSWATEAPVRARQWEVIDYWLQHKHGADFLCVDRGLHSKHDPNTYTMAESMALTHWFGDIARQILAKTDLPLWWSEYYAPGEKGSQQLAAMYASVYLHMIRGGSSVALLWNPMEGEINHYLFTSTQTVEGAQPTPHYRVYEAINRHFGAGTALCKANSSSPEVEVLASQRYTMLINKSDRAVPVVVNGEALTLRPYEVRISQEL
jgi:hypothetical protein